MIEPILLDITVGRGHCTFPELEVQFQDEKRRCFGWTRGFQIGMTKDGFVKAIRDFADAVEKFPANESGDPLRADAWDMEPPKLSVAEQEARFLAKGKQ